ncbi:hypothetical protein D3C83_325390 [compost metagenome]
MADVSGVDDEIAAAKVIDRLGPQQPVRIRDQADRVGAGRHLRCAIARLVKQQ